jgi:hypothetical protein
MSWKDKGAPIATDRPVGRFGHWWGSKRSRWNLHLRCPATTQEKRFWDAEFGRMKRSPRRIPGSHDDLVRSDYVHRNWKRHRSTQWQADVTKNSFHTLDSLEN